MSGANVGRDDAGRAVFRALGEIDRVARHAPRPSEKCLRPEPPRADPSQQPLTDPSKHSGRKILQENCGGGRRVRGDPWAEALGPRGGGRGGGQGRHAGVAGLAARVVSGMKMNCGEEWKIEREEAAEGEGSVTDGRDDKVAACSRRPAPSEPSLKGEVARRYEGGGTHAPRTVRGLVPTLLTRWTGCPPRSPGRPARERSCMPLGHGQPQLVSSGTGPR